MTLAVKPIPRVLARHNLLLGAEREPILVTATLCGSVALNSMTIVSWVVCSLIWLAALTAFRWMAKADPQLTRVYQRNLQYRGYYPAFSRPYRSQ